jgi:hypothetical protein
MNAPNHIGTYVCICFTHLKKEEVKRGKTEGKQKQGKWKLERGKGQGGKENRN